MLFDAFFRGMFDYELWKEYAELCGANTKVVATYT